VILEAHDIARPSHSIAQKELKPNSPPCNQPRKIIL